MRAAGWLLSRKTLNLWAAKGSGEPMPAVAAAVDALWAERPIDRAVVRPLLDKHVSDTLRAAPPAVVEHVLRGLLDRSAAERSDLNRARAAFTRFLELIGRPGLGEEENPYQLGRVLASKVRDVGSQVDGRLATAVLSLVEQPGLRLAGADAAVDLIRDRLAAELTAADREAAQAEERAYALYVPLVQLLAPGNAGASARTGPELADLIRQWALGRIEGLLARACANVFRGQLGNMPEAFRELINVRNTLRTLSAQLDADPPTLPPSVGVLRAVFPNGAKTATEAAAQLMGSLRPEDLKEFDHGLQARIKHEFRGVGAICGRARETGPAFLAALVDQAAKFLDARTPRLTASQVLARDAAAPDVLRERLSDLVTGAAPAALGAERSVAPVLTVLGAPADDEAARLADGIRNMSPNTMFRTVATADDIVLYQECPVSLAALPHLTAEVNPAPNAEGRHPSTHARTDVIWSPVGVQ
jgi:hypothetical protein